MSDGNAIQIRSYRVCFDLERRIHKLDRWRIPLPYGIPLRGLAYCIGLLLAVYVLSGLPITGQLLGVLHPAMQYMALPIGGAVALTRWSLDGRPAHQVGIAWLRFQLEPKRVAAFRAIPRPGQVELGEVVLAHDDRSARFRKGVVEGPARVILRYPVEATTRGRVLRVGQAGDEPLWRGQQVNLRRGQRLVVR
jgi:hypothetical protein